MLEAVLEAFDQTEHEAGDRERTLRTCIEKLHQKSTRITTLRYDESVKGGEIASRLGTTRDAVYQSLARIRSRLEAGIRKPLSQQ